MCKFIKGDRVQLAHPAVIGQVVEIAKSNSVVWNIKVETDRAFYWTNASNLTKLTED